MVIARVQWKRKLAGAPAYGNFDTYTGAWFETSNPVPTTTVRNLLIRLWSGQDRNGSNGTNPFYSWPFLVGSGQSQLTTWEWTGTEQVQRFSGAVTVPTFTSGGVTLWIPPAQIATAVGYKSAPGEHPQWGRSRWFMGPIVTAASAVNLSTSGGARWASTYVGYIAANAADCIAALAAQGWVLQVKHGTGAGSTWTAALELYVDDVFDVQRSRRWVKSTQARLTL